MPAEELFQNLAKPKNAIIIETLSVLFLEEYVQNLKPEDSLCIVGTHHFGELISKVFKISFDKY